MTENHKENSSILKIVENFQEELRLLTNKLETLPNHPPNVCESVSKKPVNEVLKTSEAKLPLPPQTDETNEPLKELNNLKTKEPIRSIREGAQLADEVEMDFNYSFEGDDDPNAFYSRKG